METSKMKYVVLAAIMIGFIILVFLLTGNEEEYDYVNVHDYPIIVLSNNAAWFYRDNMWSDIDIDVFDQSDRNRFQLFENNQYIGDFVLFYQDFFEEWFIFDHNNNRVHLTGRMFATSIDSGIIVRELNRESILNQNQLVEHVLNEQGLPIDYDSMAITRTRVQELNADIYVVSSMNPLYSIETRVFDLVFMVRDNKVITIYEQIVTGNDNQCISSIDSIFVFENDVHLVIECNDFTQGGNRQTLYRFNGNEFDKIISSRR